MSRPPPTNAVARAAAARASRKPYSRARRYLKPSFLIGGLVTLAISAYVGFFYKSHLTSYVLVQEEHPKYARLEGVPTKHFRFSVRDADGKNAVIANLDPKNFKVTFRVEPPLDGTRGSGRPAKATVFDVGQGNFLVSFRILEGVPSGHVLRGLISYGGRLDNVILSSLEFELEGPVHEPTCQRQVDARVFETEVNCPKEFSQLLNVRHFLNSTSGYNEILNENVKTSS